MSFAIGNPLPVWFGDKIDQPLRNELAIIAHLAQFAAYSATR
jgi:hypothetical protein